MARLETNGLDEAFFTLEELANIPEDVIHDMLDAEAEVVIEAQKKELDKLGLVDTAKMRDSIKADKKMRKKGLVRYINVYPHGVHHRYRARMVTKTYKRSKSGRTYTYGGGIKKSNNAEVAFIHEYGAPSRNIPAKQWMRKANEKAAGDASEAAARVLHKWQDSIQK